MKVLQALGRNRMTGRNIRNERNEKVGEMGRGRWGKDVPSSRDAHVECQFSELGGCCVEEDSSQMVRNSSTHDLPVSVDGKRYSSLSVSMCRVCVVRCSYPPSVLYCVCTGWRATETESLVSDHVRSADVKFVTRGLRALDHHQRGLTLARRLCVSV